MNKTHSFQSDLPLFSSNFLTELAPAKSGALSRYYLSRVVSIGAFIALMVMDETTVRGLLKEQQDRVETLAQQQAATFQL